MSGCALGVRYTGDELPGLAPDVGLGLPSVTVEVVPLERVHERWAEEAGAPEVLVDSRNLDGSLFMAIERDAGGNHRVHAPGYGTAVISRGATLLSVTPEVRTWTGRRLLVGQLLPLISVMNGYEVLHGGGAVVGGRLIGITAPSGTGKSSTTSQLVARGGRFFADDVLALEVVDGQVRGHPGPRLLNLDRAQLEGLPTAVLGRFGQLLAEDEELHHEPDGFDRWLPLTALVMLARGKEPTTTIDRRQDARTLLASAYHPYVSTATRLLRQLDTVAALSARVPFALVTIGTQDPAPTVAARLEAWLGELGGVPVLERD